MALPYVPTTWKSGDLVSSTKLNKLEGGVKENSDAILDNTSDINDLKSEITELDGLAVKHPVLSWNKTEVYTGSLQANGTYYTGGSSECFGVSPKIELDPGEKIKITPNFPEGLKVKFRFVTFASGETTGTLTETTFITSGSYEFTQTSGKESLLFCLYYYNVSDNTQHNNILSDFEDSDVLIEMERLNDNRALGFDDVVSKNTSDINKIGMDLLQDSPAPVHPTMTAGQWLNNGVVTVNGNQDLSTSDYIPLDPYTYKISCNIGVFSASTTIAFYTKSYRFISGLAETETSSIPEYACYFRLCNYKSSSSPVTHDKVTYTVYRAERLDNIESDIETINSALADSMPLWTGKKWCVIGDSITQKTARATKNYWEYIADGTGITVVDKGVSGSGYKIYDPFYSRIEADTFPEDCNLITMFGGVNDVVGWTTALTIGEYDDSTSDTVCGCVNLAIDALEAKYDIYCPLGIILPIPCAIDTTLPDFDDALYPNQYPLITDCRMETFVTEMKKIAAYRGYPVLDLFHDSGLRPWVSDVKDALFKPPTGYGSADGLHPNAAGHAKIYRKILEFIKTIIVS